MNRKTQRITALLLSIVMFITTFNSIAPLKVQVAAQDEFGYLMYATSYGEGAITLDVARICMNGSMMTNGTVVNTGNCSHNGQIVTSENETENISYGSNQNWLYNDQTDEGNQMLQSAGCGLIAFSDITAYMSDISHTYAIETPEELNVTADNYYEYDSYIEYLNNNYSDYVPVDDDGVTAGELKKAFKTYFKENDADLKVQIERSNNKILPCIKESLKNDTPVVLGIGYVGINGITKKSMKEELQLYRKKLNNEYKANDDEKTTQHFMVITGLFIDKAQDITWLEVSSWGGRYYVNYDELMNYKKASIFRNMGSEIILMKE